ncbi:MAG: hypothetical protein M3N31_09410 [Actinomycetota bacterium]|nr:hypothetical protein [Actinomycetota bacterium]
MRRLRYAVAGVAMAGSGVYLFVYLYRWEWHRAVIAGVLFLVAETALLGAVILERLRAIERRLDAKGAEAGSTPSEASEARDGAAGGAGADAGADDILARLKDTAPEPKVNFEWLSKQPGEMSVFVPVLLGAGVVLSGVAWVVERLARVTARPVMERGLSVQLAPFALPTGALWRVPATAPVARRWRFLPHLAALAVAALLATVGVDRLADLTQDRPDPFRPDDESSVTISTSSRPERTALETTQAIWGACTTQLGRGFQVLSTTDLGGGNVEVVVRPQIGEYAERRLRGCVADGSADRVAGRVRSITPVQR